MRLKRFLAVAILAAGPLAAVPAPAEGRVLMSAEAQGRFAAVGRLNIGGQGSCTATLIAPDIALTAAHCLVNARTGRVWRAERLHFLPGYRMGAYAAHLRGVALALPEGYLAAGKDARLPLDIALVRLAPPAPHGLRPLPVADAAAVGTAAAAISYGRDRAEAPSLETGCAVRARRGPLIRTTCEATPGVSGAPLLREGGAGPEVIGVIAAGSGMRPPLMRGEAVAVATDAAFRALRDALPEAAE